MTDNSSPHAVAIAERLKLGRNALFKRNAFSDAYQKYTEALQHDGYNAILYYNRAACSLGLQRYMMYASADAVKSRAFFEEVLNGRTDVALEFYTSTLEVLLWGKERWADVPVKTKGVIFQPTLIRAIKNFRLNAWLKVYSANPGPDSR
ncbi:hypothetical protein C8Q80DRAFT_1116530 [Daedaleopsis nitida]|nr:hypothetical protein C8Q80DRAFT_1116530 [Daedaleopsis nitida]